MIPSDRTLYSRSLDEEEYPFDRHSFRKRLRASCFVLGSMMRKLAWACEDRNEQTW